MNNTFLQPINRVLPTIVARSTPNGKGAIAIVRLAGIKAHEIALKVIAREKINGFKTLAWLHDENGQRFDQALILFFKAPNSFTGEDLAEFHCHGSPLITQKLIQTIIQYGGSLALPGEFTERAFMNGKMDLSQAEAIMDLIQARSSKLLYASSNQLGGSCQRKINSIKNNLLSVLGLIHGPIDFPLETEEVEINFQEIQRLLNISQKEIESLSKNSYAFSILRQGIKAAIIGKPNAGKSSLLNLLLNQERAIVSDEPGTTRDFLTEEISIKDIPITLIDTAGLRKSPQNQIESFGIEKTLNLAQEADLILFVFDLSKGWSAEDQELFNSISAKNQFAKKIILGNKADLSMKKTEFEIPLTVLPICSKNGQGLKELEEEIEKLFIGGTLEGDFDIALNQRQYFCLEAANDCLKSLEKNQLLEPEIISLQVENSLNHLNQIAGEGKFMSDDSMRAIFSNFCIGK